MKKAFRHTAQLVSAAAPFASRLAAAGRRYVAFYTSREGNAMPQPPPVSYKLYLSPPSPMTSLSPLRGYQRKRQIFPICLSDAGRMRERKKKESDEVTGRTRRWVIAKMSGNMFDSRHPHRRSTQEAARPNTKCYQTRNVHTMRDLGRVVASLDDKTSFGTRYCRPVGKGRCR